ncbi:hypothetical protein Taro_011877 [Colocasia esculenta]|uniref:Uncharacterized protein n=1 Tax=Colocasia esculenta TaxID=4460 RepID=A0A843U763_COLES|nr:hypothetical protein [Colocasia esculenta]
MNLQHKAHSKGLISLHRYRIDVQFEAHPKDEPYINKSIDMYETLVVICGDDQATRNFSRTVADSMVDADSTSMDAMNEETSETPPPHRIVEDHSCDGPRYTGMIIPTHVGIASVITVGHLPNDTFS